MNNDNSSVNTGHSNNFFSGFLLGILIGAAIALLFVTKKGKKILKAISEEGEGKISKIIDRLEKSVELPEESLDEEELSFNDVPKVQRKNLIKKEHISKEKSIEEKPASPRGEPKNRRFFRGVSRHAN